VPKDWPITEEGAVIDWARVEELREEIGPESFSEVAELFLEEVGTAMTALGPRHSLEQDLHFLKGSALNLGFAAFSELCAEGERLARLGRAGEIELAPLRASYHASLDAFHALCAQRRVA